MATKNIYVKDSDLPLVERAEQELGQSLSAVFADCLREKLRPEQPTTLQRIKLEVGDPPIIKAFQGRWLVGIGSEGIKAESDDSGVTWGGKVKYSAAQSRKGNIVMYTYDEQHECGEIEIFETFEDLKEALVDDRFPAYPENVIAAVAGALEIPFEIELDI